MARKQIGIKLEEGLIEMIDQARLPGQSRTGFIEHAVEVALGTGQRPRKDAPSPPMVPLTENVKAEISRAVERAEPTFARGARRADVKPFPRNG